MFRSSTILLFLVSSVGVPYAITNASKLRDEWLGQSNAAETSPADAAMHSFTTPGVTTAGPSPMRSSLPMSQYDRPSGPLDRIEQQPIERVFRFDITTQWVLGTWTRVSTSLADLDLQGYRMTLVTGTTPADLAGSLTYYFNPQQRVQRIIFTGNTGDARRLVHFLATEHRFERKIVPDPGLFLYQVTDKRKVISELRIKPMPIVRGEVQRARFDVTLVMERPSWVDK
jgi:hypothetical protein